MKRFNLPFFILFIITIISVIISSCASPPPPAPTLKNCQNFPKGAVGKRLTPQLLEKYPVSYTKVVNDSNEKPLLKITYEYTGHCPNLSLYSNEKPYNGPNYNQKRLSFYKITNENLTDYPVIIKSIATRQVINEYKTQYGIDKNGNQTIKQVPAYKYRDYSSQPTKNNNVVLEPREVEIIESWAGTNVYGEIFVYTYTFEINGKEYTISLHKVGL